MRESPPSVKGIPRSKSKASEGASQSVTRSVSSASSLSLSTEVSRDSSHDSFIRAFEEEFGSLNPDSDSDSDSDGQSEGSELDERRNDFTSIAARLPYGGLMLLLFETPSGFALFTFPGIYCYLPDSVDSIWAQFRNIFRASWIVYPKGFVCLEDKSSAITDAGVDRQLVDMIKKWHHPGMNLCVGKPEYKRIIESVLKIPCIYCQAVLEVMWGIQRHMSVFVPTEKSKLTKEDRLPLSQGLKKFLSSYGYDVKPEMVNEKIVMTACCLFDCDVNDKKNLILLRDAGVHIRDVSGIACKDWDILKLAIAVKVISCPEEELTDFHGFLAEDVVSRLKRDAPKYQGFTVRIWLMASEAAVYNHQQRSEKENLLRSLVCKRGKEAYEVRRSTRLNRKLYENSGEGSPHKQRRSSPYCRVVQQLSSSSSAAVRRRGRTEHSSGVVPRRVRVDWEALFDDSSQDESN